MALDAHSLDDFETQLRKRLVGKEVDTKFEVRALEVCGQGRELPDAGDAAPAGAVDGGVLTGAVEVHGGDVTVGADGEADEGFALFIEGRTGFLGDQGDPVAPDVSEDFSDVGAEVDTLGVGEDLGSSAHASTATTRRVRRVISGAAIAGCVLGGLAGGVTGTLIRVAAVRAGGRRWPRRFDQGLLGWGRSGRRRLQGGRRRRVLRWV